MNGMNPADSGRSVHVGSSRLPSRSTSPLRTSHGSPPAVASTPVRPLPVDWRTYRRVTRARPTTGPLSVLAGSMARRAVAPRHAPRGERAVERADGGGIFGRLHDRVASTQTAEGHPVTPRDPAVGGEHLARGGDVARSPSPTSRAPRARPAPHRRAGRPRGARPAPSSAVRVHHPLGTPGSASVAAEPARPSACRGGRSARRAVSGNREAGVAREDDLDPSTIAGPRLGPVSTRAMPTLGGGGSPGRPTSSGPPGSAGETALAWRSDSSTISPGRASVASTSPASATAEPRSSRCGRDLEPAELRRQSAEDHPAAGLRPP